MTTDELKRHPAVVNLYRSRVHLEKRGKVLVGKCPMPGHKDDTPSFNVENKDGVWLFNCFGACKKGGDIFRFVEIMENCKFNKAKEIVEKFCGVTAKEAEKVFKPYVAETNKAFPLAAYRKLEDNLATSAEAQTWLLKERGIEIDTAKKLHFGFVQDASRYKIASDVTDKGWISLPVIEGDNVTAIEFRSIAKKEFRKMPGMKTATLLGGHLIDPLEPVFLTEGGFDAAALIQAGFIACSISNASATPTPEILDKLEEAEYVVIAGDNDKPGEEVMERFKRSLKTPVYEIRWPTGSKDANGLLLRFRQPNT